MISVMDNPLFSLHPTTLTGKVIRLEPLGFQHVADLAVAGNDEAIWEHMVYGRVIGEGRMRAWVEDMLSRQSQGTDLPFAIVHLTSERAIGATRFMEIRPQHRGVEIGGTWIAPAYQRTAVNTESKYLLLTYAFETLKCVRVQLKTDLINLRSQKAIERIGAVKEGIFRQHMILPDGRLRDSVYYSILDHEWPAVKAHLERLLNRAADEQPGIQESHFTD